MIKHASFPFATLAIALAVLALMLPFVVDRVLPAHAAVGATRLLLPIASGPGPDDMTSFPPAGMECFLQTGVASVVDPVSGLVVYACEDGGGHGQIAWTDTNDGRKILLVDNFAPGSGSLAIVNGQVWLTAANTNHSIRRAVIRIPNPLP